MFDFVVCAFSNLFRIYLIDKYLKIFFGEKQNGKVTRFMIIICFWISNTYLFWEYSTVWINVISNLIGIGILATLYTKNILANLFASFLIYFINGACDVAGTALFVKYEDGVIHSQIYAAIAVFFIFVCELLCEKIIVMREKAEETQSFPLIFVPLVSVAIIVLLIYSNSCSELGIGMVSMSLLFINFLMLYLYNLLAQSLSHKYESDMLEQKVKIYAHQLDVITQSEEKVKILRHDMKHHLNEVKLMAIKYNVQEIQDYVDHMETYIQNPNEIVSSGNIEIDSVLNYMLQIARAELKTVNVKVLMPEKVKHAFDINILLGNLLENAIEAAGQTDKKFLDVSIGLKKGVLKIKIKNSYAENNVSIDTNGNGEKIYLTTKKGEGTHGMGLKSVKKIVENYNGIMNITTQDRMFCIELIMYVPDREKDY